MTVCSISTQQFTRGLAVAVTAVAILAAATSVIALGVLFAPAVFTFAAALSAHALIVSAFALPLAVLTTVSAIVLFVQASRMGRGRLIPSSDLELDDEVVHGVKNPVDFHDGDVANEAFVRQLNKLILQKHKYDGMKIGTGDDGVEVKRTAKGNISFIHFTTLNEGTLTVEVDIDGVILSAKVGDEDMEINDIFAITAQSSWAIKLRVLIREFANEYGVVVDTDGYIGIHPFALQYAPDIVLNKVMMLNLPIYQKVSFLSDTLKHSPGVDAGGLSAQFLTSLSRCLFASSIMEPTKCTLTKEEQELTRTNIGVLFSYCFASEYDEVCARILLTRDFAILQGLLPRCNKKLSRKTIVKAAEHLTTTDSEKILFDFMKKIPDKNADPQGARKLSKILEDYCDEPDGLSPQDMKDLLEEIIEGMFRSKVEAYQQIARGIDPKQHRAILALTADQFSEKIQGMEFNAKDIASRVYTSDKNPVVVQKVAWLKEMILTNEEDWVLDLLECITGKRSVTAETEIEVKGTDNDVCVAHTCYSRIDVPRSHVTYAGTESKSKKERFFAAVSSVMQEKGFTDQ